MPSTASLIRKKPPLLLQTGFDAVFKRAGTQKSWAPRQEQSVIKEPGDRGTIRTPVGQGGQPRRKGGEASRLLCPGKEEGAKKDLTKKELTEQNITAIMKSKGTPGT